MANQPDNPSNPLAGSFSSEPPPANPPAGVIIVEYWGGPHDGHWMGVSRAMVRVNSFVTITMQALDWRKKNLYHVYKARRTLGADDRAVTLYYNGAVVSKTMAMPW